MLFLKLALVPLHIQFSNLENFAAHCLPKRRNKGNAAPHARSVGQQPYAHPSAGYSFAVLHKVYAILLAYSQPAGTPCPPPAQHRLIRSSALFLGAEAWARARWPGERYWVTARII
jgi:hypothetical protein